MARFVIIALAVFACHSDEHNRLPTPQTHVMEEPKPPPPALDPWTEARLRMVKETIAERGITDERVLTAMRLTPRDEFVPPQVRSQAYEDRPLPIGFDSTISQAFIVATMTAGAGIKPGAKVLEIGTGSGYQAAVLKMMGADVYTIEIRPALAERTRKVFDQLGYRDIHLKIGDGYYGWAEQAPFDAIIVTCAAPSVPKPLVEQLKVGGRLVIPVGADAQTLDVFTRITKAKLDRQPLMDVRFGAMVGAVLERE